MASVAMLRRASEDEPQALPSAAAYRSAIAAFNDVAEAVAADRDITTLLHVVAQRICELCAVRRCSVYLRDEETGLFRGRVGRQSGRNIDVAVQRIVAGTFADRFTREIVETGKPALAREALNDARTVRSAIREWRVRALLGVPMVASGEVVGICYLDNEDEPHDFTSAHLEVAAIFANLAALAIKQAQLSEKQRESLETIARQNELLSRARAIDETLTRLVLEDADLAQIVAVVAELTSKPCVLYNSNFRRLAIGGVVDGEWTVTALDDGKQALPAVMAALRGLHDQRIGMLGPFPGESVNHRLLVAPITVRREVWGYLVLVEHGQLFRPIDPLLAARAATIVALEFTAARRAATARGEALESLTIDLIRGITDESRVDQRAVFLGVDLAVHHVVVLLGCPNGFTRAIPSVRELLAISEEFDPERQVLATTVTEGVLAIVEVPADVPPESAVADAKEFASRLCGRLAPNSGVRVGLSAVCRGTARLPRAYDEARQALTMIGKYSRGGDASLLAVDDVGKGRLLFGSIDRDEADRYVSSVLGDLRKIDEERPADLMLTLQRFFEKSCSIRSTARDLNVHENTVRYRFSRIKKLAGLDVMTNGEDRFAVQLALVMLRLEDELDIETAQQGRGVRRHTVFAKRNARAASCATASSS